MNRTGFIILLLLAITISFSQGSPENQQQLYRPEYTRYDNIYHQAEKLSSLENYTRQTEEQETALNLQALQGFKKILPAIEKAGDDSLAFHCYFKIGILEHYFDSLDAAQEAYLKAIALQAKLPPVPDSLLFNLYLYTGGVQYSNNQFEEAMRNYNKAEEIAGRHKDALTGINRLYNTLGAMYYETGNFRQAKNYFEKSVSLLSIQGASDRDLLVNYKINLAATLTRLEEYNEANTIYKSILPFGININDILHNIGTIQYKLGDNRAAIRYFRQVRYNNNKLVRLMNDFGQAYTSMREHDSARYYYLEAAAQNQKWNGDIKNVQSGLTFKFLADELVLAGKTEQALEKYQQAIIQFCTEFDETDIYKNPETFSGIFSYINLFNTLTAKADALQLLFQQYKDIKFTEAALFTYDAAFDLAGYVEENYDSDEARLFLNKIKYTAHSKPIDISLQLYELTHQKKYLEEAWLFDQRNKASILLLNMQEAETREKGGPGNKLLQQEASLRSAITRLSLNMAQVTDSSRLQTLRESIRDHEIELGKIKELIKKDPLYAEKKIAGDVPATIEIQKKLDDKTALLSYHLSAKDLLLLIVTANKFFYIRTSINPGFFNQIDSLKSSLHNSSDESAYTGKEWAGDLYRALILPAQSKLAGIERIIVIPDDELNYLPFEVLQDNEGNYLIERFSVQYQYSAALAGKKEPAKKATGLLAYAPFIKSGYHDSAGNIFTQLPASKEEVGNLEGRVMADSNATKNDFLRSANHYEIIHLATHASVSNNEPFRSFITFYPRPKADPAEYKLYAREIYTMKLDSTRLIILSACETGSGQLVKGEGLMSLSRAFAYAGCPNIITSLWKAEDKATAFLTQRLHYYLGRNETKDKALQLAKLDLLSSKDINPRLKSPGFWGHLVFIGEYEPAETASNWWGIAIALITVALIYILVKKKSPVLKTGPDQY